MLLKELTQAFGVSGYEKEVAKIINENIKGHCNEIINDALGNVIAVKEGNGRNKKRIMVSAHMDEIGFAALTINDKGFIKVRALGGISPFTTYMSKIRFKNGVTGIVSCKASLEDVKGRDLGNFYVDIGAKSRDEALKMVDIGEPACYIGEYIEFPNNRIVSKALDDRIGCYVAIESLKAIKNCYNDVYFVFSVQEEVGLRGAKVAAERIKPDIGIAVDITGSFDTFNEDDGNAKMGEGAAIKIMDNSVLCDEYLVEKMIQTAEKSGIKYQKDVLSGGGTDAGAINQSNEGVKSAGISIPTRYGHSAVGMVDMFDVNCCINLLTSFVNEEFDI